jgi:tRNA A-37 threonylcarbamoyl transferase component Bud32
MFDIGSTIADTYTIERELGRGGMGIVLLASHARLPGKKVAIKVLDARMASEEMLARFKREAHIVSVLAHPNIVHVEDYNVAADGTPYLVLEYLQGESLAQRLARGPLDLELTLSIARQIGSALAAAHARGIVHRDLKPQNVFLIPTELDGRVLEVAKVLDFGISKMLDSQTVQTEDNSLLGTPQYMAPEQATGQHQTLDLRTDLFSLGAIVYEMLSGRPAFAGASVPEVVFKVVYEQPAPLPAQIPEAVVAAIGRAMAKAPADRFSSVAAFIEALSGRRISAPVPFDGPGPDSEAFAKTVVSGNVRDGTLAAVTPASVAPPRVRTRRAILIAAAVGTAAIAAVVAYLALRRPARAHLDHEGMRTVAAQLASSSSIEIDGRRYPVGSTVKNHLKNVKFEVGGHPYEAIEQNPEKDSRWGKLAREGHRVIHFKDLATGTYLAVTVDGEPRDPIQSIEP